MYARVMGLIFRFLFECPVDGQISTEAHLYLFSNRSYPPPSLQGPKVPSPIWKILQESLPNQILAKFPANISCPTKIPALFLTHWYYWSITLPAYEKNTKFFQFDFDFDFLK